MLVIETTRLILRDFQDSDFPSYEKIRSHPEFLKFYPEEDATPQKCQQLLRLFIEQANEKPRTKYQLAITLKDKAGELIGSCGVRIDSVADKQGSLGCELGHEYWGQGYAFEASRALINFGFSGLGLHRIYAETMSENVSALHLAKKLGMAVEGEMRENRYFKGRWWNTTLLSILESEWQAQRKNLHN